MIEIELPDKGITVEFPDGTPEYVMRNAIQAEFYGALALRQDVPEKPGMFQHMMPRQSLPEQTAEAQIGLEAMQRGLTPEQYKSEIYPEGSRLKRLEQMGDNVISGALGTAEGLIGGVEWITGSETAKELANVAKAWREELAPEDPTFVDEIAMGVGSMATFFIPGIGVARGAEAAAILAPKLAVWAGVGVSSALEAMTEAGLGYRETLQDTKDVKKAEDAAGKTFWMNMVLLPITNKLGVFGEKGGKVRKAIISALMEGSQEGAQEIIAAVAQNKDVDPEAVLKSAGVGAIVGGGVSVVTPGQKAPVEKKAEEERPDLTDLEEKYKPRPEDKVKAAAEARQAEIDKAFEKPEDKIKTAAEARQAEIDKAFQETEEVEKAKKPVEEAQKIVKKEPVKKAEEPKLPTKREKALQEYKDYINQLSPEEKEKARDLIIDEPVHALLTMRKIQNRLAEPEKVKAEEPVKKELAPEIPTKIERGHGYDIRIVEEPERPDLYKQIEDLKKQAENAGEKFPRGTMQAISAQMRNLEKGAGDIEVVKTIINEAKDELQKLQKVEKPFVIVSDKVNEKLSEEKGQLTSKELFSWSDEAHGGTQAEGKYTPKDAYDAMELGINKYILKENPKGPVGQDDVTRAKDIIGWIKKRIIPRIPTQSKRTAEADEFQQFSTPPHLSYAANWVANINKDDVYIEPSAGIGGLAVFGKLAGAKEIVVNELSKRRLNLLKELGFTKYFNEDAAQLNNILPKDVKPTVVVMNPPFSATAGRIQGKRATMEGANHVEQALKRLLTNGRLVAIVGKGMAHDRSSFRDWWKKIESEYTVLADIGISGKEYSKYGTTFDNRILIIDKTGPTTKKVLTGDVEKVEDLIPLLEGVRNARTHPGERPAYKPGREERTEEIETKPGPEPVVLPTGGEVGDRQRQAGSEATRPTGEPGRIPVSVESERGHGVPTKRTQPHERPSQEKEPVGRGPGGAEPTGQPIVSDTSRISEAERSTGELQIKTKEKEAAGELTEDLYEGYRPERLDIPNAKKHPTPLVQSAAMAAVTPPSPFYNPSLPPKIIKAGNLSEIQLESIVYAGQSHSEILPDETRRGYFIGDGTGVGKGREIAGIIWDNWTKGRKKAVWISEKASLFQDAKRDVQGAGWDPEKLFIQNKVKATATILGEEGVLFTTYDTLKSSPRQEGAMSRLEQIVDWLGEDFDGVIAFDESHNMGNAIAVRGERGTKQPSAKALAGVELQNALPNARIVYVSATGATEVINLAYCERLGLWGEGTPFSSKLDFVQEISSGGIAAMELVARDMKSMGIYNARSLSYEGVSYDRLEHELTPSQVAQYNKMAQAWQHVLSEIHKAMEVTGANENGRAKGAAQSAFWGAHQRFFNQVITSIQLPTVINSIHQDLKNGDSVVVQLVNTLEAAQERALARLTEEDSLEDLDLSPFDMLMQLVEHSYPVAQFEKYMDDDGNIRSRLVEDSQGNVIENADAVEMRERLLDDLGALRREVAENPIDQIIEEFGIENVAEVTGRRRRVVYKITDKGRERVIEKRSRAKAMADADAYMDGKKKILVFSEAGGTGRSYHADLDANNQDRRIHYLLQPGWRADKAVQGLGRTHRSNQKQPPVYRLCTTNLKGQKRFLSSIARRLDQLGALTKGSRKTGSQGIFQARDNLESDYARDALRIFFDDLVSGRINTISVSEFEDQTGLRLVDEYGNMMANLPEIRQFLNRILSMNVELQNAVFDEFSQRVDNVVESHIKAGTLDQGLETLKAEKVEKISEETVHTDERSGAETKYVQLNVTNKAPILEYEAANTYAKDGFFRNIKSGKVWAATVRTITNRQTGDRVDTYVLKSHTYGEQRIKKDEFTDDKWEKLTESQAKTLWQEAVDEAPKTITRQEHLITGTLLPIWNRLIGHPRIMRVQTNEGERMIGRIIGSADLERTLKNIGAKASKVKMDPGEIHARVLDQNYSIDLANQWRIFRRRVSGDQRIEIAGLGYSDAEMLRKYGLFSERINYQTRYFIPTGKEGISTISQIVKNAPVVAANPPVTSAMGAKEGQSIFDALGEEAGFINIDMLVPKRLAKKLKEIALNAQNSRLEHWYNYIRGRQDAKISVILQKKHTPQLGHWIRNMESILSQTDEGRKIYESGREFKEKTIRRFRKWEANYNEAVEGLSDQEKKTVLKILDSTEEITGDHPAEVAAEKIRTLLQDVREYLVENGHQVGYLEGYLPHIFQGRFWVSTKDEFSHKVETIGQALQIAQEWIEKGKTRVKVMQDTFIPPDDATMLSQRGYWRLVKAIQNQAGESIEILNDLGTDEIHQMLSKEKIARPKPRRRFFGNLMRRVVGNPNYIKNLDEIMRLYFYGASRKVGQDIFWRKVQRNMDAMPAADQRLKQFIETVYLPGTLAHPTNMEEAVANIFHKLKIVPGFSSQDVRKIMHNVNLVQYVWDLGLSGSSAIANASQFFINAYPIVGEVSAAKGYRKGAKTFFNRKLLAEVEKMGITQGVSAITGEILVTKDALKEFKSKMLFKAGPKGFAEATLIPFTTVEVMNRFSTYWAGKDFAAKQLKKGKSALKAARLVVPDTSSLVALGREIDNRLADKTTKRNASWRKKTVRLQEEFAQKFGYELNDKVNFRVGRENLPQIIREVPARLFSPYKSFLLNQLKYTVDTLNPKGVKTNPKKALRFTIMTLALAGVAGNPVVYGIFQMLRYLYKQLFGVDIEKELRRKNLTRGIPGKLGLDISGSVAIQMPKRLYDLLGRYGKIAIELGNLAYEKGTGAGTIRTERKLKRQTMPAQLQRVVDAMKILERGEYITPITRTPVAISEKPWVAAVKRAAGILPADVAKAFDEEREIEKLKKRYKSLSSDLTERWAEAVKNGDPEKMDRTIRKVVHSVNNALDRLNNAKGPDDVTRAMTDLLFWQAWIEKDQKFKNAILRKHIPRQIEKKRRLPKYLQPEAVAP